jgi:hypothetical protein
MNTLILKEDYGIEKVTLDKLKNNTLGIGKDWGKYKTLKEWKDAMGKLQLNKGDAIISMEMGFGGCYDLLILDEPATAYGYMISGDLTDDDYVVIITDSGEIYELNGEPQDIPLNKLKDWIGMDTYAEEKIYYKLENVIKKYNVNHILVHV